MEQNEKTNKKPPPNRFIRYAKKVPHLGIFLAVFSAFCISFDGVVAVKLPDVPAVALVFYRAVFSWVFMLPMLIAKRPQLFPTAWKLNVLLFTRSVCFCAMFTFMFLSFRHINIGDTIAILFIWPPLVVILSRIFLKEHLDLIVMGSVLVSITGVVLIAQPPSIFGGNTEYSQDRLVGIILATGSGVTCAMAAVILRSLRGVDVLSVSFNLFSVAIVILAILTTSLEMWVLPKTFLEWFLIATLALLSLISQLCFKVAISLEMASVVSAVYVLEIVFTYINQIIFINSTIRWFNVVGALLIISGATTISVRNHLRQKCSTEGEAVEEKSNMLNVKDTDVEENTALKVNGIEKC